VYGVTIEYQVRQFNTLDSIQSTHVLYSSLYNQLNTRIDYSDAFWSQINLKSTNSLATDSDYQINHLILSDLNIGYMNEHHLLSLGRNELILDWMMGSFDSLLYNYSQSDIDVKLFWAYSYEDLLPNYLASYSTFNRLGLIGTTFGYELPFGNVVVYDYYIDNLRNILGSNLMFTSTLGGVELNTVWLSALEDEAIVGDESIYKVSTFFTHHQQNVELGATYTGDNGVLKLYEYGVMNFNTFMLGNNIYYPNAINLFARYELEFNHSSLTLLGGYTWADQNSMEIDLNYHYDISNAWYLDSTLSLLTTDIIQNQIQFEVGYRYE
jgi:hypothetical protein